MDRGKLVGQANIFQPYQPQLQEEVPGGIAPVQQDNQFKLPTDGIAVKRELTKKLFKNYSDLKNFMNAMAQQGIDPTMPDPSTDDGGQAYQVFLNMDANVRYAANELANEQKAMEQLRPYLWNNKARYAQGVDPQQAMISQDPNAVVSLEPTAATEQANLRLNTPTYTNQDERDFNKAYYDQAVRQIDRAVAAGQISAEQGEIQKQILQPNVAQTAYQQLIPRNGRASGPSKEDLSKRAELIKQIKRGIVTNDQAPINMMKLIPGVKGVKYVNSGDQVGLEIDMGDTQPAFIDLSQGGGEADINALLNRIEGQKNIPNEAVFDFDTKVEIPASNVKPVVEDVKSKLLLIRDDTANSADVVEKLKELAGKRKLNIPDGVVSSVEVDGNWFSKNDLVIKYHPKDANGKINYSKTKTKTLSEPEQIAQFVDFNSTEIAPEFGGGFETKKPEKKTLTSEQEERKRKALERAGLK